MGIYMPGCICGSLRTTWYDQLSVLSFHVGPEDLIQAIRLDDTLLYLLNHLLALIF